MKEWAAYRRTYLVFNLVFYGIVVLTMVVTALHPSWQDWARETFGSAFPRSMAAARHTDLVAFLFQIFLVNVGLGCFLILTLPSMIFPWSGLLAGVLRACLWGLWYCPAGSTAAEWVVHFIPLMILEGQAYLLVLLSVYIHGLAFWRPRTLGADTRLKGYRIGFGALLRVYALAVPILALAALYEAVELMFFF